MSITQKNPALRNAGFILMPYIIGRIGDAISLQAGMAANLVPCVGILVLSLLMYRRTKI